MELCYIFLALLGVASHIWADKGSDYTDFDEFIDPQFSIDHKIKSKAILISNDLIAQKNPKSSLKMNYIQRKQRKLKPKIACPIMTAQSKKKN